MKAGMKIVLIRTVPCGREHGLVEGRVCETVPTPKGEEEGGTWVLGDMQRPVRVFGYEYELFKE